MINKEKELTGGNMSTVTTDGENVYKDIKEQSKTIHRLLQHLESNGFNKCPKSLGFDAKGRERLSFVDGDTIDDYPLYKNIELKKETIKEAALLLKEFHNATIGFKRSTEDIWYLRYPGKLEKEVICHNDFAPYNVTFKKHIPIGIIDFDTACPAPRVWDIAYAM
ncbi:MAG: aminoglycoside phosphotransferase family protein [Coprobacillaceae bacterium]